MTERSIEMIWHFIGYLHLDDIVNKIPVSFEEGHFTKPDQEVVTLGDISHYSSPAKRMQPDELVAGDTEHETFGDNYQLAGLADTRIMMQGAADFTVPDDFIGGSPTLTARPANMPMRADNNFVMPDIELSYEVSSQQSENISIVQNNSLVDNDLLLDDASDGVPAQHGIDVKQVLGDMLAKAATIVPDLVFAPTDDEGLPQEDASSDGEEIGVPSLQQDNDAPAPIVENAVAEGHYVDGVLIEEPEEVDEEPSIAAEEESGEGDLTTDAAAVEKMAAAEEGVEVPADDTSGVEADGASELPDEQEGEVDVAALVDMELQRMEENASSRLAGEEVSAERNARREKEAVDSSDLTQDEGTGEQGADESVSIGFSPSGGAGQFSFLGDNSSANLAQIVDVSDAYGSLIVEGDYFETNAIVQANILSDNDEIAIDGEPVPGKAESSTNKTHNDASFKHDNDQLFGNAAYSNIPTGLNWEVDYIEGNFFDITSVIQQNLIVDNDVSTQSASQSHFAASLGDNMQMNTINLYEFGVDYDLIIVAGDYHEFNAVVQVNILLDDDSLGFDASSGGGREAAQQADGGGNKLYNLASIENVGGGADRFQDLEGNVRVEGLASSIEDMEASLEFMPEIIFGMPGSGSQLTKVLYVEGDYYDYKTVFQTNVIVDVDYSEQILAEDSAEAPDFTQSASSGGNVGINSAGILDVDSTSDFQFLGGDYYEDSLLVQAEILVEEDSLYFDSDEGQGLDGTEIAALAIELEDGEADCEEIFDIQDSSSSGDIMGELLS